MRKLTKTEMLRELPKKELLPVYDIVVQEHCWSTSPRTVWPITAYNEIEAARIAREQHPDLYALYSITLREDLKVWA
jgi:hypothetical protein